MSKFEFVVPTLFGLEGIAGDELRRMNIENVRVELGDDENLNGKITELRDILNSPEINISEMSGTLYLDNYDENNSNPMYSFIKD